MWFDILDYSNYDKSNVPMHLIYGDLINITISKAPSLIFC